MEAKMWIVSCSLLLAARIAISSPTNATQSEVRIPIEYDLLEKYSCVKKFDLFFDRALLFKYADNFLQSWPGNGVFDCSMTISSRTSKMGIIGVIQKMKYRKDSQCVDYIKFNEGESKRCGDFFFGLNKNKDGKMPLPPPFISEFSGPFLRTSTFSVSHANYDGITVRTSKRTNLVSPGAVVFSDTDLVTTTRIHSSALPVGDKLEFEIAYTGYKDCDNYEIPEGWFNCGYGVCILNQYVNDGVVNCPFGDCRDEGNCEEAMLTSALINGRLNSTERVDLAETIYRVGNISRNKSNHSGNTTNLDDLLKEYLKYNQETLKEISNIGNEFKTLNSIMKSISDDVENMG